MGGGGNEVKGTAANLIFLFSVHQQLNSPLFFDCIFRAVGTHHHQLLPPLLRRCCTQICSGSWWQRAQKGQKSICCSLPRSTELVCVQVNIVRGGDQPPRSLFCQLYHRRRSAAWSLHWWLGSFPRPVPRAAYLRERERERESIVVVVGNRVEKV